MFPPTDDDTRVPLEDSDNTSNGYINASYITVRSDYLSPPSAALYAILTAYRIRSKWRFNVHDFTYSGKMTYMTLQDDVYQNYVFNVYHTINYYISTYQHDLSILFRVTINKKNTSQLKVSPRRNSARLL